jgi:hypothetical protein
LNKYNEKVKHLLSAGGEIAGGAVGGVLGFLAAGPGGAAAGGALGAVIPILSDIASRTLSRREEVRVGAVAAFALERIKTRLDNGDKPRDDGFFSEKQGKRSDAEEIFEGVLLKAKNEYQEKKSKILGNIFANTAFANGFSLGEANRLLQITEDLTYRQICILALVERKSTLQEIRLRTRPYDGKVSAETASILQEIYDMYNRGLLSSEGGGYYLNWSEPVPGRLILTVPGKRYYIIMGLADIPVDDLVILASSLGE